MSYAGESQIALLINTGRRSDEEERKREAKVMEQDGIFYGLHKNIKGTILKSMTRQERADKIMVERRREGRLIEEDESGGSDKREIAKGRKERRRKKNQRNAVQN